MKRQTGRIDAELVWIIAMSALMLVCGLTSIVSLCIALSQGCAQ